METPLPIDYYLKQLSNPLTAFIDKVPRGEDLRKAINRHLPPWPDEAVRALTLNQRLRLNANVAQFHLAMGRDIELGETLLDLLETSYTQRRPTPELVARRKEIAQGLSEAVATPHAPGAEAVGRALIGCSGSGKTRTLCRVLAEIPQVVALDPELNPLLLSKMITWIRVETPSNRKISALVEGIITAIGTAIGEDLSKLKRGNISVKIEKVAMLVMELHVGVIVIDELQHVLRKGGEPDLELMNFLVELSNRVGVPLLLVGTPQSEYVAANSLRQARRMIGRRWLPLARGTRPWTDFSERLLGYQFTGQVAKDDELEGTLFKLSQGLPAIAVALFQLAQRHALLREAESGKPCKVGPDMLEKCFSQYMHAVAPMLEALRTGNQSKLALYQDIAIDPATLEAHLMAHTDERAAYQLRKLVRMRMDVDPKANGNGWRHAPN